MFTFSAEFEDWRPGLAQLLQPVPFPDEALADDVFIRYEMRLKSPLIKAQCSRGMLLQF